MPSEYADLLIQLAATDVHPNVYRVTAELDDGTVFSGLTLPLDEAAFNRMAQDVVGYGQALRAFLFAGELAAVWPAAKAHAAAQFADRLRVRLRIEPAAAALQRLAWEKLIPDGASATIPWSTRVSTPFSRYLTLARAEEPPVGERPLRVLVALASPTDLAPAFVQLDTDAEIRNVWEPLQALAEADQFALTVMPGRAGISPELTTALAAAEVAILSGPTTMTSLAEQMGHHHLVFFVGHGAYGRGPNASGNSYLFLENKLGMLELAADVDFANLLAAGAEQPHLLFLSACETAQRVKEDTHPFVGLGPRLIEAGVPAVVAMQELVPVKTAHELVRVFARQLARHGLVDRAVSEARLPLYSQGDDAWSVPVLFMRARTGRIALGNPVYELLQRMRSAGIYARPEMMLPLPIDVVHVIGMEDATNLRQLSQEQAAARTLLEAANEIFEQHETAARRRRRLIMLIGERGTAKSTQLRELAQDAVLFYQVDRPVLPIIIDLSNFPFAASTQGGPLQYLIWQTLNRIWPELQSQQFESMLTSRGNLTLRFLFDGSDDLTAEQRFAAWQRVSLLATRYPHHEYLLASDPDHLDRRNLTRLRPTDMLVMQPLLQPQIKQFLERSGTESDLKLLSHLQRHHLFDLVEIPWLMARIWGQAKEGSLPESRTAVLTDLVEEALSAVEWLPGMRTRARVTLQALAWQMQEQRVNLLAVDEAFRQLRRVRGDRDYPLESLFANLVGTELLGRVGDDMVRFTNPQVQAYLCAREIVESPQWELILEDITATLGRLGRLRWWSATLVYLAGLLDRPRILVDNIVYGVNLLQSEQIFLAVRCILEMTKGGADAAAWRQIDGVADQIIDGLIWRLNRGNEPNISRRIRIVEALGQMRHGNGVAYLARLANVKVRQTRHGDWEYEPSYVRMAAVVALHRQMPEVARAVRDLAKEMSADAAAYEQLADILAAWHDRDQAQLVVYLQGNDNAAQVLAAFALADWQPAGAFDALVSQFFGQEEETQLLWALVEALALFETKLVLERVILPLLDEDLAGHVTELTDDLWARRSRWYRVLAYLIGKTRAMHPRAIGFLDDCLNIGKDMYLKGKAIEALGWLYDEKYRAQLEAVAVGDFAQLKHASRAKKEEKRYLQKKALLALAFVGDRDSLNKLRGSRHLLLSEQPELEEIFFQTTEEIYWRYSAQRQQEMGAKRR